MSTVSITIPRSIRPVMRAINHGEQAPGVLPVVPSRASAVLRTLLGSLFMLAVLVGVLFGVKHLDVAIGTFTAPTVGAIATQHVPSAETPAAARVAVDPSHTVRSAPAG